MPKALDTQGFSGLRKEVVRPQGSPSRSPVQQALIYNASKLQSLESQGFQGLYVSGHRLSSVVKSCHMLTTFND